MRVAFFGQSGPYAPEALRLLGGRGEGYGLVLVVEGTRRGGGRHPHRMLHPAAGPLPEGESLNALARAMGLPVLVTRDVNDAFVAKTLKEYAPDVIVCVGFDRLFARHLLDVPPLGGINAHPSRLPLLRGPSPLFWALKQGLPMHTLTLHGLDAKEDHGPIYAQQDFDAPPRIGGDDLFSIAGTVAGRMLIETLETLSRGELRGEPQDHSRATRAPRPKPEDSRVYPEEWDCEPFLNFVSGAPFFRAAWMRTEHDTFFFRRGLVADVGAKLPAHFVQTGEEGSELLVQCRDGVASVEIQI